MAHVLVGAGDDPAVCRLIEALLEDEGQSVTRARSHADTIAVLRSSLHPLVVVLFDEGTWSEDLPVLLELALEQRDTWEPHAYIVIARRVLDLDTRLQHLIAELGIAVLCCPFRPDHLFKLVEDAAARIGAGQ